MASYHKEYLAKIAADTIDIMNAGHYTNLKKKIVSIKEDMDLAVKNTKLYTPEAGNKLLENLKAIEQPHKTKFEGTNETTLKAAKRLIDEGFENVVALNFASARKPGGGFKNGATAQEESLARSSALYNSIAPQKEMYKFNDKLNSGLYSDYMIFSPNVPVFKDDLGNALDESYKCSFITSPAVNATHLKPDEKSKVRTIMKTRIEKILAVALENGCDAIVLGAFGCGVFGNRPVEVAQIFKQVLNSTQFKGQFKKVTFAVYDKTQNKEVFNVFKNTFGR